MVHIHIHIHRHRHIRTVYVYYVSRNVCKDVHTLTRCRRPGCNKSVVSLSHAHIDVQKTCTDVQKTCTRSHTDDRIIVLSYIFDIVFKISLL
jgi:hypothetical protein